MKLTRSLVISVAAAVLVLVIGVAMFVSADQPFTEDGVTAQRWVEALCAEDMETLYALSAVQGTWERSAFAERAAAYLRSGEVPFPCVGEVNFNLVRDIAVPLHLVDTVDRAVQFSDVVLQGANDQVALLSIWAYRRIGGGWTIWAPIFGATRQGATTFGQIGQVLDGNGLTVGTIQIMPPVEHWQQDGEHLIALPVRLTTYSRVWEHYEAQLYTGQTAARSIERADSLPEAWRADFLPPVGGYLPQHLQRAGRLWFSVPTLDAPMTLAFTARPPFSGTTRSAFLDVSTTELAPLTLFNPFVSARFVEIAADNPVFEIAIDTADMPNAQIRLECGRFVLVTLSDTWLRGTDCTFTEGLEQTLLPGERLVMRVTFAGYNLGDAALLRALTYRRRDDAITVRYDLWSASDSPP